MNDKPARSDEDVTRRAMNKLWKCCLFLLAASCLSAQTTIQYSYDEAGRLIAADYGGGNAIAYTYDLAGNLLRRDVTSGAPFATVSAASFEPNAPLAAEMIVSGFGLGLATGIDVGRTIPLPTELLGTSVDVTDSQGVTRPAPLFFVAPGQINYMIPEGTALGAAKVLVTSGAGGSSQGVLDIELVAPSLFAANEAGVGVAAAVAQRFVDGVPVSFQNIFTSAPRGSREAVAIDLGPESDRVILLLFGSGIRFGGTIRATIGGQQMPLLDFAPSQEFVGLDQVNVDLLRTLIGAGEVDIVLTVDNKTANTVTLNIQ